MGFWSKLFGQKKGDRESNPPSDGGTGSGRQSDGTSTMQVPKSIFVDDSDPQKAGYRSALASAKYPIDVIYDYLREDYEAKGYSDAISHSDRAYMKQGLGVIKSKIELLFREATLKYTDGIRDVTARIKGCEDGGLLDIMERLQAEKDKLESHISELSALKQDFEKDSSVIAGVFSSYERGFQRGIAIIMLTKT
jgi:hypothetical protein